MGAARLRRPGAAGLRRPGAARLDHGMRLIHEPTGVVIDIRAMYGVGMPAARATAHLDHGLQRYLVFVEFGGAKYVDAEVSHGQEKS